MALLRIRVEQVRSQSDEYNSLAEQLIVAGRPFYQFTSATAGIQTLEIDKPYQMGYSVLLVFLNGLKMQPTSSSIATDGDYQELDETHIRFVNALNEGDVVEVRMEGKGQGTNFVVDHYHQYQEDVMGPINGSNTIFTLNRIPAPNSETVFVNGIMRRRGANYDYTIYNSTITFMEAPPSNAQIIVNYEVKYVL